jgi:dihydrofolate reductase
VITLIAAIGRNNELGLDNKLIWNIPADMKHFKEYTTGKVVVMGRKTFQSIGRTLPGRKNVIISTQEVGGVAVHAKDIEAALSIEHCYPELVIIGGSIIYRQTIDKADKLVITHIDDESKADSYFPKIDLSKWKINSVIEGEGEHPKYKFVEYVRHEVIRVPN